MDDESPWRALLSEARRLRNLGRYPEAEVKFREAVALQDDVDLKVELASMFAEQGRARDCYEYLMSIATQLESGASPAGRMLLCCADAGVTVQFSENLRVAISLYNDHLRGRQPQNYEKFHVPLLCNYLALVALADMAGGSTASAPVPSLEFLHRLFGHMVKENQDLAALSIARQYAARAVQSKTTLLLRELLEHAVPLTPGENGASRAVCAERLILRADIMTELANRERKSGHKRAMQAMFQSAARLYTTAGHVTGSAMTEVYGFDATDYNSVAARQRQRQRLLVIKDQLEQLMYYDGIRSTLSALYDLALADRDLELLATLDSEYRRLSQARGFPLDVSTSSQITISRWKNIGALTADMLRTYEVLYNVSRNQEAPVVRAMLASSLGNGYSSIGDTEKATYWKDVAEKEPPTARYKHSQFLLGQDTFFRALEEQTKADQDEERERSNLLVELQRMEDYLDPDAIPPDFLHFGIMKLLNMCDLYMGQIGFRGIDGVEIMTNTCLEYSDRFIVLLNTEERTLWKARVIQRRARLLFVAACSRGPSPSAPHAELLARATEKYNEAGEQFRRTGAVYDYAMVLQNLYNCYRLAWQHDGRKPLSALFGKAVRCLEEPEKALKGHPYNVSSQRLNRSFLFGLWAEGLVFQVQYGKMRPLWRWMGLGIVHRLGDFLGLWRWLPQSIRSLRPLLFTTPLEEASRALDQTVKLIDQERLELSALPGQGAILAKQHLRRDAQVAVVFQTAPVVFILGNQAKPLWQWIQRSKARSISDLLGIGNIIPSDLAGRINADPLATSLLAAETALATEIKATTGVDQFTARRKLDLHQNKMRTSPHLAELLDLREGKPVDWRDLAKLKEQDPSSEPRRTWFIDWIVANGFIFLVLVSDDKEFYYVERSTMNAATVSQWIRTHLDGPDGNPLSRPLDIEDTSLEALLELRPLVAPITALAAEGDRLVLCPSAPLHRVPLHAVIVKGGREDDPDDRRKTWQTLAERNPLVYTSSLTIYKQNMTKRLSRSAVRFPLRGKALAVYEEPALKSDNSWEAERSEVYRTCASITSTMDWGDPQCGNGVHIPEFTSALQSNASMVYFCGHFHYDETNVLNSGLLLGAESTPTFPLTSPTPLAPPASTQSSQETTLPSSQRSPANHKPPSRFLTTSDLLRTKVNTPHVILIACGSAQQKVSPGDEPLGVVTALLYAGATSVTGTMWPINSGDGREFSEVFFEKVKRATETEGLDGGERNEGAQVLDLAVVLQATVRKLRRREDTSRPYSWAGFVGFGGWCL